MCFSATASFAAAGLTGIAGATALRSAGRSSLRWVGAIPVLFAVHQFAEGMLWLALSEEVATAWTRPAMFTYLTVARVVWPTWVPLAIRALESEPRRRRRLSALLVLGAIVSLAEAYALTVYPVGASIDGRHVEYRIDTPPLLRWPMDLAYVLTTVLPPFVSSNRTVRLAGAALLVALVVSKVVWFRYFASVWCFFAALISVGLVLALRAARRGPALAGAGVS
jgi:hypothetical protein